MYIVPCRNVECSGKTSNTSRVGHFWSHENSVQFKILFQSQSIKINRHSRLTWVNPFTVAVNATHSFLFVFVRMQTGFSRNRFICSIYAQRFSQFFFVQNLYLFDRIASKPFWSISLNYSGKSKIHMKRAGLYLTTFGYLFFAPKELSLLKIAIFCLFF